MTYTLTIYGPTVGYWDNMTGGHQ